MKVTVGQQSTTRLAARTLALGLALTMTATRAGAQVEVRTHDDTVTVRAVRITDRARVRARIDSLRRLLGSPGLAYEQRVIIGRQINREAQRLDRSEQDGASTTLFFRSEDGGDPGAMENAVDLARLEIIARNVSRGWIGLNVEAPHIERVEDGTVFVRYFEYPQVVSVDVNSPAEHAGVARGDVLVAFDGQDVRDRDIDMTRLLVPGRRVRVTLRRDDDTKVLPVLVAAAPAEVRDRRAMTIVLPPDPLPPMAALPPSPRMWRTLPMPAAPRAPSAATESASLPEPPEPPAAFEWYSFDPARAPVAGARLAALNEGLVEATGTKAGVFVVEVAPSSPAGRAGLRGGDVIVRAGGTPVRSVAQLRAVLEAHADDQRLALSIVRGHRARELTLRW